MNNMTSSATPTLWFGPPSYATGLANDAGSQFMDLFNDPAAWQVTAGQTTGVVLTEAFVATATNAQLTEVFSFLAAHHMQMALVTGIVPIQANGIGNNREGFTAAATLANAVQRISSLGGVLNYVAMDSPLVAGHEATYGPQLSITALAQQVAANVALVKAVFPNVQFTDAEQSSSAADLAQWAQAFQQATGSPIAEFGDAVNWGRANTESGLQAFAAAVSGTGATFGIFGDATAAQPTNLSWALTAESNIAMAEAN